LTRPPKWDQQLGSPPPAKSCPRKLAADTTRENNQRKLPADERCKKNVGNAIAVSIVEVMATAACTYT